MKNGGRVQTLPKLGEEQSSGCVFPSVFMRFEVSLGLGAVSDLLFVPFHPAGSKTHPTKEATVEDADFEALKWFLSGVFNPILLRFNTSHLNHIRGVLRTARRVYTPIK